MLHILGSAKKLCDGMTRREMLTAGGLSLLGLNLADDAALPASTAHSTNNATAQSFGRAKACILLYLYGGPSQLETFDMKPDAPVEIRGDIKPIASRLPECPVAEYLPRTAQIMDRVTVVRSLTHIYPIHSISFTLTGLPQAEGVLDANPRDPRHWPFIGSVLSYLHDQQDAGRPRRPVPDNIALPFPISSQRPAFRYAGFQPSFLGNRYAPVWSRFQGEATQYVVRPAYGNAGHWEGLDPYLGITPESRLAIAPEEARLDLTLDQLDQRRSLLEQLEQARRQIDGEAARSGLASFQDRAFTMLTSKQFRTAMDLGREPMQHREKYGMTLFGQSTLLARRLVEAGCRFVTVIWDEYGVHNTAWDTHHTHFPRMKGELLPALDAAYSSLILDLEARGMLDDTLVLCLSEHGRAPRLTHLPAGGRDHWSQAYTNWFAGGGIARGRVIGRTDRIAGSVTDRPLSPKDILATVYHLLGFDPNTLLRDRLNRPLPLTPDAEVVREMLA